MGEPTFRKPIFGAVWRYPELDLNRLQRVGRRGFLRLVVLVPLTLSLVSFAAISVVYATTGIPVIEAFLIGFALASSAVLILRGWMLGTYVNGNGFKIVTLLTTRSGAWSNCYEPEVETTVWRCAGIPLGIASRRVILVGANGTRLQTHVYLGSIDGIFTRERFDVLYQLLRRWSTPE